MLLSLLSTCFAAKQQNTIPDIVIPVEYGSIIVSNIVVKEENGDLRFSSTITNNSKQEWEHLNLNFEIYNQKGDLILEEPVVVNYFFKDSVANFSTLEFDIKVPKSCKVTCTYKNSPYKAIFEALPEDIPKDKLDWIGQKVYINPDKGSRIAEDFLSSIGGSWVYYTDLGNDDYYITSVFKKITSDDTTLYWKLVGKNAQKTFWYRDKTSRSFKLESEVKQEHEQLISQSKQEREYLASLAGMPVWYNFYSRYAGGDLSRLTYLEQVTIQFVDLDNNIIVIKRNNGEVINWQPALLRFSANPNKDLALYTKSTFFTSNPFEEHPNWSNGTWDLIKQRKVEIGMNEEMARMSWGSPESINTTTGSWGTHEQWVYGGNDYLYFENGILTSIQN